MIWRAKEWVFINKKDRRSDNGEEYFNANFSTPYLHTKSVTTLDVGTSRADNIEEFEFTIVVTYPSPHRHHHTTPLRLFP